MFDELSKYKKNGHFFFQADDQLAKVSNVPKDFEGIYLIYALERGRINLVYINSKLPEGHWAPKMLLENIEALDVYWYVTQDKRTKDVPKDVEEEILEIYQSIYGTTPRWNERF
ncbi:MAG: hypothetical protein WKF66_07805 [Pedobacter sp.]